MKICADHFHPSNFISEFEDRLELTAISLIDHPPQNHNIDTNDAIEVINEPSPAKKARTITNEQINRKVEV